MKKVINGKVYDTKTAQCVAEWSNNLGYRDFSWMEETLYRKKTGEFFLHGEGGPMTRYASSCGSNSWTGGESIHPMTYREAQEWAEEHLDGDEYEEIFGAVVEDDSKTTVAYCLSKQAVEIAKRAASKEGSSVSALIERLILGNLNTEG